MKSSTLVWMLGVLCVPAAARAAEVCVEVDVDQDSLEEGDRKAATKLLESAFRQQGQTVVAPPCAQLYRVYHLQLGKSVQVVLNGPAGERNGKATMVEELGSVYDQMVRSLVSPEGGAMTRENVTVAQTAPRRATADDLWVVRLGPGTVLGGDAVFGPSFGFGYRYELDSFGVDASLNFTYGTREGRSDSFAGSFGARILGLYFFDGTAASTLYGGLGFSYGSSATEDEDATFRGTGLQGDVTLGFEFLRYSTIRMFAALDATLPFYRSRFDELFSEATSSPGPRYTPTLGLTFGIGWGGDNAENVNVTQVN